MARSNIRFSALDLGPLPADLVGSILRCSLLPGIVHFSAANQIHAFEQHGEEFLACLAHAGAAVIAPHLVGQSPHHPDGFEMVREIGEVADIGSHILVALTLFPSDGGRYPVQSVYPIGFGTVQRRLRKGHLFRVE